MHRAVDELSSRVILPEQLLHILQPVADAHLRLAAEDVIRLVQLGQTESLVRREPGRELRRPEVASNVFFSYNSKDAILVRELENQLCRRGISVWRDKTKIVAGQWFVDELERGIAHCESVIIVVGAHGLGNWEQLEYRAALSESLSKDKRLIPVLLPGVDTVPDNLLFLKQLHVVKFENDVCEQEKIDEVVAAIRSRPIAVSDRDRPTQ
jgi:hypothetical protein